jgi:predicted SAM-dependent methyltransferase
MDWKTKSAIIRAVERLPFSDQIYYLMQRYITHSIPRNSSSVQEVIAIEQRHLAAYTRETGKILPAQTFEFGAGWDLCAAVVRSLLGVPSQNLVDLNRLASAWQINHIGKLADEIMQLDNESKKRLFISNLEGDLLNNMGIKYLAPSDARDTIFIDNSIDLIVSTNTLEHIPKIIIVDILKECQRILSYDGIMSFIIDYSDHYSHSDDSIGPYNYIKYNMVEWHKHNHDHHFQNRLRHNDYEQLFGDAGFEIITNESYSEESDSSIFTEMRISNEFDEYSYNQLLPTSGWFVLRRQTSD